MVHVVVVVFTKARPASVRGDGGGGRLRGEQILPTQHARGEGAGVDDVGDVEDVEEEEEEEGATHTVDESGGHRYADAGKHREHHGQRAHQWRQRWRHRGGGG